VPRQCWYQNRIGHKALFATIIANPDAQRREAIVPVRVWTDQVASRARLSVAAGLTEWVW
jgi:hypothetical protein